MRSVVIVVLMSWWVMMSWLLMRMCPVHGIDDDDDEMRMSNVSDESVIISECYERNVMYCSNVIAQWWCWCWCCWWVVMSQFCRSLFCRRSDEFVRSEWGVPWCWLLMRCPVIWCPVGAVLLPTGCRASSGFYEADSGRIRSCVRSAGSTYVLRCRSAYLVAAYCLPTCRSRYRMPPWVQFYHLPLIVV